MEKISPPIKLFVHSRNSVLMEPMKVLVTGSSGLIGSEAVILFNPNSEVERENWNGARPSGCFIVGRRWVLRAYKTIRTLKRRERRAPAQLYPHATSEFGFKCHFPIWRISFSLARVMERMAAQE